MTDKVKYVVTSAKWDKNFDDVSHSVNYFLIWHSVYFTTTNL